ncbi:response regulator transcription factor [Tsuneonella amylolytica]|uniref:response regulator transcription factor n=1 Tax=Tsuneonella amylolytica TaxID=2338327 RepID=UPI000EA8CEC6|nr:LuxR C-terminal-related transcriptional regulator [Tsuneonella amylolytica]
MRPTIVLFDGNEGRRASIAGTLRRIWHVEPFDDIADLVRFRTDNVIFALVDDRDGDVEAVAEALGDAGIPVIAYSDTIEVSRVVDRSHAGAIDYLEYPFDFKTIRGRVENSLRQRGGSTDERRRKAQARAKLDSLSARETDVIRAVAIGSSNKGIAQQLGISPRTVEIHRANMFKKLDIASAAEATRLAIEADLV